MATLRVNVAVFRKLMEERGWNERELATEMGLAHSYVNRVLAYKRRPGTKFVAGALQMGLSIEQAFILEDEPPSAIPLPKK